MSKKQLADALLRPFGLELRRRTDHEEKPWDHTFRRGIRDEEKGGDPNDAVSDAWGKPEWAKYIVPHLRDNMTICEIGPGVGRWTKHVIDKSKKLYLVDYSKVVCDYWRAKGDPRIEVIQSLNTRLPQIPEGSIDLFMSFDVFVHMDIEIVYGYLEEAFRILKPSGIALIDYLSLDDDVSARWFIKDLNKQDTYGSPDEVKRSIFRVHHKETVQVLAEAIGFSFSNVRDTWHVHNICTLTKP
ncbi:MAG: class I SAM-dependent methyltransferase [Kiritimatiellae bacterium]|nr:class I SAM-dependent methyltransferase [Kiritimatiellia bacterium]MCO5044418.1 class I SAM-dependent methyltransferase [Kiritimatiellia bacterium]MCO5060487.1 class I SAM-dependent methyltransferase [Kiritimatiellia bacterium]MCO5068088.1 class I SAM-dependent methyltransferase [Kiritimatiellia bacterium]